MDWLTFTAESIKALAWPGGVVVVAVLFRKPLSELIDRIRRASWKDLILDFDRELKATEPLAVGLPKVAEPKGGLVQIASSNPVAAIIGAWSDIEKALLELAERRELHGVGNVIAEARPIAIARMLSLSEHLSDNDYRLFAQLRQLRNVAVHGASQITQKEAEEYISLASRFIAKLKEI
ncbi:MAG: hypothetical protein WCA22_04640 [Candidatus Binatus sp.]